MSLGLGDYLVTMEKSELKGQLRKQILTDLLTDLFILSQCQVNAKADSAWGTSACIYSKALSGLPAHL